MKRGALTAEILAGVAPSRTLPGSAHPPDWRAMEKWLATLSKPRGPMKNEWAAVLTSARRSPAHEEAAALLAGPSCDALATASLDALAVAERVVLELAHGRDATRPRRSLIGFIAEARGLLDALEVFVRARTTAHVTTPLRERWDPSNDLRAAVARADDASYAAALVVVERARSRLSLHHRAFLSYAFPDERWAVIDLEDPAYTKHHLPVGFLLSAISDLEVVKRFLSTRHAAHSLSDAAFDLVATIDAAVLLPLLESSLTELLKKPSYGAVMKTPPRQVAAAIAAIGSAEAAAVLARFAAHPILAPQILEWFRVHPEHASLLETSSGGKAAAVAKRIATKAGARGVREDRVASVEALPPILRDRPWLRRPAPVPEVAGLATKGVELERIDEALLASFDELHPSEEAAVLGRQGVSGIAAFVDRDWVAYLPWEGGAETMRAARVIVSPAIAPAMARVLTDRKTFRHHARAWFLAHPDVAALGLVPAALGGDRAAEVALTLLAASGHRDAVVRAAAAYGARAEEAITVLLARDPRHTERSVPKRPSILKRDDLPPLLLRDGATQLGAEAVDSVIDMLSLCLPDAPYAGIVELREALDEQSFAAFALELLEQWSLGDAPGRADWMGYAVVHVPSDAGTSRLAALAREWSTKNQAKCERACVGLAAIGTDPALLQLTRIARGTRFRQLGQRTSELMNEVAAARGLSADELEDRTVPELDGLDTKARAIALETITRRLERMLISGRSVDRDAFDLHFVKRHALAAMMRALLWETDDGTLRFRVAEDGTLADLEDAPVVLGASMRVRLAHPAREAGIASAWATVFADYQLIAPFEQLGRAVRACSAREARSTRLDHAGAQVPAKKLLGLLESRGWRRDDGGAPSAFLRDLGDVRATLPITPGFEIQSLAHAPVQSLGAVTFSARTDRSGAPIALGAIDRVVFSEIARDLEAARALG